VWGGTKKNGIGKRPSGRTKMDRTPPAKGVQKKKQCRRKTTRKREKQNCCPKKGKANNMNKAIKARIKTGNHGGKRVLGKGGKTGAPWDSRVKTGNKNVEQSGKNRWGGG